MYRMGFPPCVGPRPRLMIVIRTAVPNGTAKTQFSAALDRPESRASENAQRSCAAAETGAIRSSGRLFIPPALRERDVRLGEFVSYGEDTMFHCGAIAL